MGGKRQADFDYCFITRELLKYWCVFGSQIPSHWLHIYKVSSKSSVWSCPCVSTFCWFFGFILGNHFFSRSFPKVKRCLLLKSQNPCSWCWLGLGHRAETETACPTSRESFILLTQFTYLGRGVRQGVTKPDGWAWWFTLWTANVHRIICDLQQGLADLHPPQPMENDSHELPYLTCGRSWWPSFGKLIIHLLTSPDHPHVCRLQ
jgi:hypothetical protein